MLVPVLLKTRSDDTVSTHPYTIARQTNDKNKSNGAGKEITIRHFLLTLSCTSAHKDDGCRIKRRKVDWFGENKQQIVFIDVED